MDGEKKLLVMTNERFYYFDPLCDLDEDGSLVRLYLDGQLQFACPRENFKWCEVVIK